MTRNGKVRVSDPSEGSIYFSQNLKYNDIKKREEGDTIYE